MCLTPVEDYDSVEGADDVSTHSIMPVDTLADDDYSIDVFTLLRFAWFWVALENIGIAYLVGVAPKVDVILP